MPKNIVARLALLTLVCAIACDVESEEGVIDETEQVAEDSEPQTEEEFRDWACILEPEVERRRSRRRSSDDDDDNGEEEETYCLTKCKGYKWTRADKESVDLAEVKDKWCSNRAEKFCTKNDKEYDKWCWGVRED